MDWLSLLLVTMIIALTYLQSMHGLVSTMIMCVTTLICAPVAFAVYEWIGINWLQGMVGDLALPIAFMACFLIPLIVIRLTLDILIKRESLLPIVVDRAMGAVAGFVGSYMLAGMVAVATFMIPFGGQFMGRSFIDLETGKVNGVWLGPERFAVGFAEAMSEGLFQGATPFTTDHPDLLLEFAMANSARHEIRQLAPPGSIEFIRADTPKFIFDKTPAKRGRRGAVIPPQYAPVAPAEGHYWLLVRCLLKPEAQDSDDSHRFAAGQVRLLGYASPDDEVPNNYYPKAINDNEDATKPVTIKPDELYTPDDGGEIEFVFEVPDNFVPRYLEYKLGARIELPETLGEESEDAVADSAPSAGSPRSGAPATGTAATPTGSGGRVSGARGRGKAVFSDALPTTMTNYQRSDFQENRGALANGHIWGNRDDQSSGSQPRLTRFDVPTDKRMLQLDVEVLRAGSTLGRALSFAVKSLKDYELHDKQGRTYPVVGQFAVANVDGTEVVEIQYFPSAVAATNRGGIREFARIKDRHLKGRNYRLVYLFLVEPGAEIDKFTTGAGRRPTNLSRLNLVAPP